MGQLISVLASRSHGGLRPVRAAAAWERLVGPMVALTAAALCLPFVSSVHYLSDEGIWLHAARRMVSGEILYRDFFEIHPPVGFLIVSGWTAAFGGSLVAARLLMVLVAAATAWSAFCCCRIVSNRPGISAWLALLWVATSQHWIMQVGHHAFTGLFSIIALHIILSAEGRTGRLGWAGAAAAAATLVTTHRGGLVAAAGFLTLLPTRSPRAIFNYTAGGIAVSCAVAVLLLWQGNLAAAIDQVILYSLRHYSNIQGVSFGAFVDAQTLPAIVAFPFTAILLALGIAREGIGVLRWRHLGTALLFALTGLLGCFPRPDAPHLAFGAVLALPLLAGLLSPLMEKDAVKGISAGLAALLSMLPLVGVTLDAIAVQSAPRVDTRMGSVAIMIPNGPIEVIHRLKELPSDDSVFFYPYDPMLPVLTGRRHPARLDILVPQYSTPAQYFETCREVMHRAQWVVFDVRTTLPEFFRTNFPAMTDPSPPEKVRFEALLRQGFVPDQRYGDFQLLRRADARPVPCRAPPPAEG